MATKQSESFIEKILRTLEKKFGVGILFRMTDSERVKCETFSSGSFQLDRALGVGGYPYGRIIEIFGPEAGGKTTLALHAIAEIHRRGQEAAFIDAEYALDSKYAESIGVDMKRLLVSQPDSGEQALELVEELSASDGVKLVVVDSVAALVPKSEIEGDIGDMHIGLHARLMSQALRKLTSVTARHDTTVIFINQIRHKIANAYGNPETTTGGVALKFYASIRLDVRRVGQVKEGEEIIGNRTRVKVVKNKLAPPFKNVEFDIVYGKGVARSAELLDNAIERGIIEKSGAWFSLNGNRLGQGRQKVLSYLEENPDIMNELASRLIKDAAVGAS
ncbi:MAG: recombinase RecA [Myxococcota bacterium]